MNPFEKRDKIPRTPPGSSFVEYSFANTDFDCQDNCSLYNEAGVRNSVTVEDLRRYTITFDSDRSFRNQSRGSLQIAGLLLKPKNGFFCTSSPNGLTHKSTPKRVCIDHSSTEAPATVVTKRTEAQGDTEDNLAANSPVGTIPPDTVQRRIPFKRNENNTARVLSSVTTSTGSNINENGYIIAIAQRKRRETTLSTPATVITRPNRSCKGRNRNTQQSFSSTTSSEEDIEKTSFVTATIKRRQRPSTLSTPATITAGPKRSQKRRRKAAEPTFSSTTASEEDSVGETSFVTATVKRRQRPPTLSTPVTVVSRPQRFCKKGEKDPANSSSSTNISEGSIGHTSLIGTAIRCRQHPFVPSTPDTVLTKSKQSRITACSQEALFLSSTDPDKHSPSTVPTTDVHSPRLSTALKSQRRPLRHFGDSSQNIPETSSSPQSSLVGQGRLTRGTKTTSANSSTITLPSADEPIATRLRQRSTKVTDQSNKRSKK